MKKNTIIIIGYILTGICFLLELIFSLLFRESIYMKFPMTFINLGGFILFITIYYKYKSNE